MKVKIRSILRLAFPYILMALLPIVSVVFLSTVIVRDHTEEILQNQDNAIKIAVDRVDEKLDSVEDRAILITDNDDVRRYLNNGLTGKDNDIIFCQQLQSFLSVVSKIPEIDGIYLYDGIEGRIISSHTVLYDASFYFDYLYRSADRKTDDIISELKTALWRYQYFPAQNVVINGREELVIEYRISVPVNRYKDHSQLVIALDVESVFQDYFDALSDGAEFRVYCGESLVYSSSDCYADLSDRDLPASLALMDDVDGKLYAVERTFNGGSWRVQYFYPKLAYTDNRNALMTFLAPAVSIPVVMCILLCIFFTHKNRREIMEILSLLRSKNSEGETLPDTEYIGHDLILTYAGDMAKKFAAYEDRLREVHASQRNSTLERLVRNAYRSEVQKRSAIDSLELPLAGKQCAALCVQFDDAGTAYMVARDISARDIIEELLEIHVGTAIEVFDNLSNEVVAILSADEAFTETADNIVSLLNVHIKYRYGIELHIGIGSPVEDIRNIHLSYHQARDVIRYKEQTGRNLNIFDQIDTVDQVMLYPLVTDEKISNYMTLGKADEAKAEIMEIYREYFGNSERILSLEAIDFIKYRITNTVLSVAERQGVLVPADAQKLLSEKNAGKYFAELTALVDSVVEQITSKKNNAQNVLAIKVHDYIHEHYTDSGLTIKQIAAQFHFHENYVSNLYKEEYGENLSTAIEMIRIEKACEMLGMTDTKIGEVAEAVGYSSDSSFRRAFKKITGVSPVDYRNSH